MVTIQLENEVWTFDPSDRLGKLGGFGGVFRGNGAVGDVAVKRLREGEDDSAAREIRVAAELARSSSEHIVPALDYGLDPTSQRYYIVMPLCEMTLSDWLIKNKPSTDEAREIALEILQGLKEARGLVHRDLKPSNILRLNGKWAIADFGIARFVEESTSLNTLKDALTPAYAAPEQWRSETASVATDVYSLGCILFEMVAGTRPFKGSEDEVRNGHLFQRPPALGIAEKGIESLVMQMMRKSLEARPTLEVCMERLRHAQSVPQTQSGSLLQAVSLAVENERAADEERKMKIREREEKFKLVADEACEDFQGLRTKFFDQILALAPAATRSSVDSIQLGRATLTFGSPQALTVDASKGHGSRAPSKDDFGRLHVAAYSILSISNLVKGVKHTNPDMYRWHATAFFAQYTADQPMRWHEVGFWGPMSSMSAPYSLSCGQAEFYRAFSSTIGVDSVAYGPFIIDGEFETSFHDRWTLLFSVAAKGRLVEPSALPINSNGWSALRAIAETQ